MGHGFAPRIASEAMGLGCDEVCDLRLCSPTFCGVPMVPFSGERAGEFGCLFHMKTAWWFGTFGLPSGYLTVCHGIDGP